MIDRITSLLRKESQSITAAGLLLGTAAFAAKIVGLVRDNVLASHFGATAGGRVLDIYYAGFRIPDLLLSVLILGAVSSAFLPVFTERYAKDPKDAWRLTNNILTLAAMAIIAIAGLMFFAIPYLMPLVAPGFNEAELIRTVSVTRLLLLSPVLFGISSIVSAVLHHAKRFLLYAMAPVLYNVGIITGTLLLSPSAPELAPAFGAIFGALLHLLVQIPGLTGIGFRFHMVVRPMHDAIREIIYLSIPRTANLVVNQFQTIALTAIASVTVGAITVFNLATNLAFVPVGIVGISFATAAFPALARSWAEGNIAKYSKILRTTVQEILFFALPASVMLLVLRAHIVRVVLGRGLFSWEDTRLTAATLAAFAVGVVAFSLQPLLVRAFFARKNTKTPLWVGIITAIGTVGLALLLTPMLLQQGAAHSAFGAIFRVADLPDIRVLALPVALSLFTILQVIILLGLLKSVFAKGEFLKLSISFLRLLIASLVAGVVTWAALRPLAEGVAQETGIGILLQGAGAGLIGGFVYLLIAFSFSFPEAKRIVTFLRRSVPPLGVILPNEGEYVVRHDEEGDDTDNKKETRSS